MRRTRIFVGCLALVVVLATGVAAQFGSVAWGMPLDPATGSNGHLGVQVLGGYYYVSTRVTAADPQPMHQVHVLDAQGQVVGQFDQPSPYMTNWGYRDGATDGVSLMFGYEGGIEVMSPSGQLLNQVQATNGSKAFMNNPIQGEMLSKMGVCRGLAFDPDGNDGNGSFWVANWGRSLCEFDLDGMLLREHPNAHGWSIYGLALDPLDPNVLWAASDGANGNIFAIDKNTGIPYQSSDFPRGFPGSVEGGLCARVIPNDPTTFELVGLDQSYPDTLFGYHVYSTIMTAGGPVTPPDEPTVSGTAVSSTPRGLHIDLHTEGSGDVNVEISTNPPVPGGEIYNLISTQDIEPDGSGPIFGVGLDAVQNLLNPPGTGQVYHVFLDGAGRWSRDVQDGLGCTGLHVGLDHIPFGFHVEIVSLLVDSNRAVIVAVSNVVSLTL